VETHIRCTYTKGVRDSGKGGDGNGNRAEQEHVFNFLDLDEDFAK
jgi:hypothetical protein